MAEPEHPTLEATTPMGGVIPRFDGSGLPPDLWADLRRAFEPRYELRGLLGRGGMGVVLEAYDPVLERPLAIKILSPDALSDDPTARERLLREARAAATLSHPNVVSVFGVGETPNLRAPYILMQRIMGETLEQKESGGPLLDVASAARLLGEVAEALSAAHALGMVHRDLKPSNVMVDRQTGRAVVLDFGISHWTPTAERREAKLTGTGMYVGTPLYMSPEQAAGEPATDKSDIYSLGCLMYEVLAGRRVFDGESAMVVMAAHIKDTPASIRALRPEVPLALERTLMAMLAKDPALRPTADDLRRQFAPVPESHPWGSARLDKVRGLLRSASLLGLTVGGIAALGLAWVLQLPESQPGPTATLSTALSALIALLFGAYLIQVVRATVAVAQAGLSWGVVCLLAGDRRGEVGRIVNRLQRFALLDRGARVVMLDRKRSLGRGLLLSGPVALVMLAFVGMTGSGISGRLEPWVFASVLLGVLLLKSLHDRTEVEYLGETALTFRWFTREPLEGSSVAWFKQNTDLLGPATENRPRWGILAVGVVGVGIVAMNLLLFAAVQFVATSVYRPGRADRNIERLRYAVVRPMLEAVVPVGPLIDAIAADQAWDQLYGVGIDSSTPTTSVVPLEYWAHRALFPGQPGDSGSVGNEIAVALHGLSSAQRRYLEGVTRDSGINALAAAARSEESNRWRAPISKAIVAGTAELKAPPLWNPHFTRVLERGRSLAALHAARGRYDLAERQLLSNLRVTQLDAGAARGEWEWRAAVWRVSDASAALSEFYRRTGRALDASRVAPPTSLEVTSNAPADSTTPFVIEVSDTTLSRAARWTDLRLIRRYACNRPMVLWTDHDPEFDSVASAALRTLAINASDSSLVDFIRRDPYVTGRRVVQDPEIPLPLRAFPALFRATGRTLLAGCFGAFLYYY